MDLRGLEQAVPGDVARALDLHAERRRQGIPTVSVLIGPAEQAVATWREWLGARGTVLVEADLSAALAETVARAWLQPADPAGFPQHEIPLRLSAALLRECPDARSLAGDRTAADNPSPAELIARVYRMSPADRRHLLDALAAHGVRPGLLALAAYHFGRGLLDPAEAAKARARLLTELSRAGEPGWQRLVQELSGLWPERREPGVIALAAAAPPRSLDPRPYIWIDWIDQSAGPWFELAERAPWLSLAFALEPGAARAYLARDAGTRVGSRLRNALVWLPEAEAAPESADSDGIARTRHFLGRELGADAGLSSAFERAVSAYRAALANGKAPARGRISAAVREAADRAPEAEDRARSEAERLLFLALERSPATRGLFTLNQRLDVRFGRAPLEIDLYCARLGLAVEVDGYYHFRDAEAYRRDRRKDLLLQSLDHIVLRCLAEDVVLSLEQVLASITGAVVHRQRRVRGIHITQGMETESP